jgi:hypothetical protein
LRGGDVDNIDFFLAQFKDPQGIFERIAAFQEVIGANTQADRKRGPTQARTLSTIKVNILARFSTLPPNSSVRLLNSGDKNWLIK